jgi:hypothetical protein
MHQSCSSRPPDRAISGKVESDLPLEMVYFNKRSHSKKSPGGQPGLFAFGGV